MSLAALNWAIDLDLASSSAKLVLVVFSNYSDEDGFSYPSVSTISAKTCLDRKTVISTIRQLEEMHLLQDTGKRVGKTGQVPVYQLEGLPTADKSHYVFKIIDPVTGDYYIGTRSCAGSPSADLFNGCDKWSRELLRQQRSLNREIIGIFPTRQEAEAHEIAVLREAASDLLCRNPEHMKGRRPRRDDFSNGTKNGTVPKTVPLPQSSETVPKTEPLNSPKNGTVPKTEQYRFSHQTVPFFPSNSTVFSVKQSQKRDTYTGVHVRLTVNDTETSKVAQSAPATDESVKVSRKAAGKPYDATRITLPEWLPVEAWNAFVEMRKRIKKPLTSEYAAQLVLSKLAKLRADGEDPVAALNQSIMNSWQGVFAPKPDFAGGYAIAAGQEEEAAAAPAGFPEFYEAYPPARRMDVADGARLWIEQGLDRDDRPAMVLGALKAWMASDDWTKNDGRYIPGMAKFLRERRYEAAPHVQQGYGFDPARVSNGKNVSFL